MLRKIEINCPQTFLEFPINVNEASPELHRNDTYVSVTKSELASPAEARLLLKQDYLATSPVRDYPIAVLEACSVSLQTRSIALNSKFPSSGVANHLLSPPLASLVARTVLAPRSRTDLQTAKTICVALPAEGIVVLTRCKLLAR